MTDHTVTIRLSAEQRETLLRAATFLSKEGIMEDVRVLLRAARLVRKIARDQLQGQS